jgi:hypothetical protein
MSERIEWTCFHCGDKVEDGEGFLQVRMPDVMRQEEATAEWEARHTVPGGGVEWDPFDADDPLPYEVPWNALHDKCDAAGGEPYAISIEELRTPWDLVRWTADLMGKNWLGATTWDSVLRRKHDERNA